MSWPVRWLVMVLAACTLATPVLAAAPGLAGRWVTQSGDSTVEFGPCARSAGLVCGRIVALRDPTADLRRDVNNPATAERQRPILGLEIIRGLRPSGPGFWTDGDLYNPDDGRTYRGAVRLRGEGSLELRGCALAIICRSQIWRRV